MQIYRCIMHMHAQHCQSMGNKIQFIKTQPHRIWRCIWRHCICSHPPFGAHSPVLELNSSLVVLHVQFPSFSPVTLMGLVSSGQRHTRFCETVALADWWGTQMLEHAPFTPVWSPQPVLLCLYCWSQFSNYKIIHLNCTYLYIGVSYVYANSEVTILIHKSTCFRRASV